LSARYRLIAAGDLDAGLLLAWRAAQASDIAFASPYFCPEFTQAVAGVRDDVRVVVIENDGRAVGFFPFQRGRFGSGKPVGGAFSDYHGVIASAQAEWQLDELVRAAGLSVWRFDHLSGHAARFAPHVSASATSPQLDLRQGFEHYDQQRRQAGSEWSRKTNGLARKLGREVGELSFTFHDSDPAAFRQTLAWKSEQYRRGGGADVVFSQRWTVALLEAVAAIQTPDFAGVHSTLRVGGRMVAGHMGMRSRTHLHYWFPSYDADQLSRFSTGSILLLRMAEAAPSQGVEFIDLGKGDAQYKRRLMSTSAPLAEGAVELPSLLTAVRRLQRAAEARHAAGGLAKAVLDVPVRAARRLERELRFR
jgi:CelD/BcsL family acetyltransferase involved in cellulose biosynthesis